MFNFTDMPEQPNLLSHRIEAQGTAPQRSFEVVFDYPDCVRIFNGKVWRVEAKAAFVQKMKEVDMNVFFSPAEKARFQLEAGE